MTARLLPAAIVLAGVALWALLSPPGANDVVGGDEGYYGTTARNILADPRQLASPSLRPLGPPGDKPPLYPALLAASVLFLGPNEGALRWPSFLFAALVALCTAALAGRATTGGTPVGSGAPPARPELRTWAAVACAVFLVTLPWFADGSRIAAAEPPLTGFAALGLLTLAAGPATPRRAFAAGALFGLAFLCKLWLVVLLAIPAAAMLVPAHHGLGWRAALPPLGALAAGGVLVGGLHLVAVAILAPRDLGHWWSIYWGFSLTSRLAGESYAPYWMKPPWFYWMSLAKAYVLLLPLAALGLEHAARRFREPVPRALLLWSLGGVVLSAFRVKAGGYLYPVVPAWAALAALGLVTLAGRDARPGGVFALLALGSAPPVAHLLGGPEPPAAAWSAAWTGCLGALALVRARPALGARVAVALGVVLALGGLARVVQRLPQRYHVPGYRAVAAALAPVLENADPARASFVAPEAPAFSYYLFRSGRYWGTPLRPWTPAESAAVAADTSLRAFVVDPSQRSYGGWPDSAALAWLEHETREVTGQIESRAGRKIEVRVFVRPDR